MPLYDNTQVAQLVADAKDALYLLGNKAERDAIFGDRKVYRDELQTMYGLYEAVSFGVAKAFSDTQFYALCAYLRHKIDLVGVAVAQGLRIITHPVSMTVNEGAGASFSVVALGINPLTYQWRKNGVNIPGANSATYSISVTAVSDAGSYDCVVTDATSATVTSNPATLVVNAASLVTVEYGWSTTDPYSTIVAGDPFSYSVTESIAPGSSISMDIPLAQADGYYFVTKVPSTEPVKNTWYNTALNQGTIPDSNYRDAYLSGGFRYYVTRVQLSVDTSVPLILS